MKRYSFILAITVFCSLAAHPQSVDIISVFLRGGIDDANKLTQAYMNPMAKAVASANNSAWNFPYYFKDGKAHLWFDIKYNHTFVPETDRSYDLNNLNLKELEPTDPAHHIAQTLFGDKSSVQMKTKEQIYIPFYGSKPLAVFNSPEGSGTHALNIPYFNLGVIYRGFNLIVRGLPPLPISGSKGSFALWGVGAGITVNDFFDKLKDLPFVVRINGSYSSNIISIKQDLQPDEAFMSISGGPYNNQYFKFKTKDFTFGMHILKNVKKITFSGGIGYDISTASSKMTGTYPVYVQDPAGLYGFSVADVEDPIDVTHKNNYLKAGLGAAVKLGFFLAGLDFTFGRYNGFTAGMGFVL